MPSLGLALGITVVAVLVLGVFRGLVAFFSEATEEPLASVP